MNSTLENIKRKIVDPEISKIKQTVVGFITAVYYKERRCDIVYFDTDGAQKKIKRLPLPEEGSGLFNQAIKSGDKVELSYRNRSDNNMFISKVYRRSDSVSDFGLTKGEHLPHSTDLF